jgi:hypothetical protein
VTQAADSQILRSHPGACGIYDASRGGVIVQRTAFPRLYVPPEDVPELPRVPVVYHGKRSAFGPVTVYCVAETREIVSAKDWRGADAIDLAGDLLDSLLLGHDDQEQCEAFAREVLTNLPEGGWELSVQDIRDWNQRWCERDEAARCNYPPETDADEELPGAGDEARMLELVKKLGRSDDE